MLYEMRHEIKEILSLMVETVDFLVVVKPVSAKRACDNVSHIVLYL